MEYKNLDRNKFSAERISPMIVGKLIGARSNLDLSSYPQDSYEYTQTFLNKVDSWIQNHQYLDFNGFDSFTKKQAIIGCTQQLDELHYIHRDNLKILEDEYAYHWRLNPNIIRIADWEQLSRNDVLVVSYPFVGTTGNIENFHQLLNRCQDLDIPVHIDGAWFAQCKDVSLDLSHPAIHSFSVSLSKAYFMGSQRIGIRYTKYDTHGPISIMNNFGYNNVSDMWIGLQMIEKFGVDFWWKNYSKEYYQVCKDFNLTPSNAINIAYRDGKPISIRTPLRMLIDNRFDARGYNV